MQKKKLLGKIDWYLTFFIFGLAVLSFLVGGLLGIYDRQPFRHIHSQVQLAREASTQYLDQRPILLKEKTHHYVGVRSSGRGNEFDGLILMQGWFSDGAQIRMIDHSGRIRHQWFVDFFDIWPEPSHVKPASRIPNSRFNFHTQGFIARPDGTVLVSLGNLGAAKLDWCSNVVWTVDHSTHHVITPDGEGGYWMAGNRDYDRIPTALLFGNVSRSRIADSIANYENLLLKVDAQGKVTHQLSILESLSETQFEHRILDSLYFEPTDLTHINDIELVTEALAARIVGVQAGDLLVSIRQLHMLAIMDAGSGKIKWTQTGPWVRQHDPDIMPDGTIRVFNNGGSREFQLSIDRIPGSNIIEFDPSDRSWEVLLPVDSDSAFFTDEMGSYQALPNGHHLVAESRAGRILQFAPDGKLVWEFIAEYNDEYAALIEIAEWIPEDYFDIDDWDCQA